MGGENTEMLHKDPIWVMRGYMKTPYGQLERIRRPQIGSEFKRTSQMGNERLQEDPTLAVREGEKTLYGQWERVRRPHMGSKWVKEEGKCERAREDPIWAVREGK